MSARYDLVVRGGCVATSDAVVDASIAVRGEQIAAIGLDLPEGAREIDARGRIITPGGVDPHAHIEQLSGMGLMNADSFESATRSAALGGTTTVISFAAQRPGQRLAEAMADYERRAARGAMIDHAFHVSVSDTSAPDFADDLAKLIRKGHRSIKLFTTYNIRLEDRAILDVMAIARRAGALVCVHAENDGMIDFARTALVDAGLTRPEHHALSRPKLAEIEAVDRICRFAELLDQPVMIFHVSTQQAAAGIRMARGRGVPVLAETCPHYLFMTHDVLRRDGVEGAKWMCSPPQRDPVDQEALWTALALGDLEVISSDHAPYRFDTTGKLSSGPEPAFPQIANGLPGLETRMPLLFDAMASQGRLGICRFVDATATAPARIYGLATKGRIAPGMDADLVVWDPAREVTYGANDLHDNVGYNPWEGRTVRGWPERVILRGREIVGPEGFSGQPGSGRWLERSEIGAVHHRRGIAELPELGE